MQVVLGHQASTLQVIPNAIDKLLCGATHVHHTIGAALHWELTDCPLKAILRSTRKIKTKQAVSQPSYCLHLLCFIIYSSSNHTSCPALYIYLSLCLFIPLATNIYATPIWSISPWNGKSSLMGRCRLSSNPKAMELAPHCMKLVVIELVKGFKYPALTTAGQIVYEAATFRVPENIR